MFPFMCPTSVHAFGSSGQLDIFYSTYIPLFPHTQIVYLHRIVGVSFDSAIKYIFISVHKYLPIKIIGTSARNSRKINHYPPTEAVTA